MGRWYRTLLALVLAAALVGGAVAAGAVFRDDSDTTASVGVGRGRDRSPATTSTPPPTTTTIPVPTTAPRDPRRGNGQAVTFAFGGDIHFEGDLRAKLQADPPGVLAPVAGVLSGADIAVVNLETAVTERGAPEPKDFTFRAPPVALEALGAAGVDVASLANNHGLDYGIDGLTDTLAAKSQSLAPVVIGVGANATEAYAPRRVEVKGQRIAVFAATQVLDDNLIAAWTATDTQGGLASAKPDQVERLLAGVRAARLDSDTVVVFLHWGVEGETCPSEGQRALAQQLVDAGADVIVGGHAHRQQGAGRFGTAFVAYGLGNFVFYNESGPSGVSGVLQLTAVGRDVDAYSWVPAVIRGGVAEPLPPGPEADAALGAWNELRPCSGLGA